METDQSDASPTDDQLARRSVLQRCLTGLAAGTVGLAGCSGGGSDGSGSDGGSSDGTDGGDGGTDGGSGDGGGGGGATMESMCSVEENTVDQLSVIGCQSTIDGEELIVTVTIRNEGDQEADLWEYDLGMEFFTGEEPSMTNDISAGSLTINYDGGTKVAAGETIQATGTLVTSEDLSVGEIQHYTIQLTCGMTSDGVYCE